MHWEGGEGHRNREKRRNGKSKSTVKQPSCGMPLRGTMFVCVDSFHSHSCLQPRPDHWGRGLRGTAVGSHQETLTNGWTVLAVCVVKC